MNQTLQETILSQNKPNVENVGVIHKKYGKFSTLCDKLVDFFSKWKICYNNKIVENDKLA